MFLSLAFTCLSSKLVLIIQWQVSTPHFIEKKLLRLKSITWRLFRLTQYIHLKEQKVHESDKTYMCIKSTAQTLFMSKYMWDWYWWLCRFIELRVQLFDKSPIRPLESYVMAIVWSSFGIQMCGIMPQCYCAILHCQ